MILTSQLNPSEDERARALLKKYGNPKPGYFANLFAGSCHVAESYLDVIRYGFSQISEQEKRNPDKRETRRDFYLGLIAAHLSNRDLVRHFRF